MIGHNLSDYEPGKSPFPWRWVREEVAQMHSAPDILQAVSLFGIEASPSLLYFQFNKCHEVKLVKPCHCGRRTLVPTVPEVIIHFKKLCVREWHFLGKNL